MTEPVVRWTTGTDGLADVVVGEACDADPVELTEVMLRNNPFAALAVAVSGTRMVVRTESGHLVELIPRSGAARCLDVEAVVRSAAQSLYAWHVAGLDLGALRPRGLPVWCADHRAHRSTVACGWLGFSLLPAQSSSDVGRL